MLEDEASKLTRQCTLFRRLTKCFGFLVLAAPSVGLVQTIWGMIRAFGDKDGGERNDPTILAGDVSTALTNTAIGIAVAIPLAFFFILFLMLFLKKRQQLALLTPYP